MYSAKTWKPLQFECLHNSNDFLLPVVVRVMETPLYKDIVVSSSQFYQQWGFTIPLKYHHSELILFLPIICPETKIFTGDIVFLYFDLWVMKHVIDLLLRLYRKNIVTKDVENNCNSLKITLKSVFYKWNSVADLSLDPLVHL